MYVFACLNDYEINDLQQQECFCFCCFFFIYFWSAMHAFVRGYYYVHFFYSSMCASE